MTKLAVATLTLLIATSSHAADLVESIVARVGDRIITRSQYVKRLEDGLNELRQSLPPDQVAGRSSELRKTLIDDMLNEMLIKDRADRLSLSVSPAEIAEAVKRLKGQYGLETDEQFVDSLRKSGMTRADMESRLRDSLLTNKVFARELRNREDLNDRELRERYTRERDQFRLPERARVREIVILKPADDSAPALAAARSKAQDIARRVRAGETFETLAKELSESPTKEKGGELGEIARGELLTDLDSAVFNLNGAGIAGPVELKSSIHILKVEERLPSEVPSFESVRDRLRKDASEETFQRDYKAYIERLRKDAFVQVNEKNLPL
ncbi:MAG TPA: peptidylprolyl isomerase [Thermoanaerobaculia bacterium]|nr:peptidylprolyl isomerase [Thermoanaerobaculia bacterium]